MSIFGSGSRISAIDDSGQAPGFLDRVKAYGESRPEREDDLLSSAKAGLSKIGNNFSDFSKTAKGKGALRGMFSNQLENLQARANDPLVQSSIATAGFSGGNPLKDYLTTGSGRTNSMQNSIAQGIQAAEDEDRMAKREAFLKKILSQAAKSGNLKATV